MTKRFVAVGMVAFLGLGALAQGVTHGVKTGVVKTAHGIVHVVTLGRKG